MSPEQVGRLVRFTAGPLSLAGHLTLSSQQGRCPGVVVCHPHPLYGGDMDNSVVRAVCAALVSKGLATLRFNFRGVGSSQGTFDQGAGEQEDLRGALAFLALQPSLDPARLGVVGYSFGAIVALAVAAVYPQVKALCAISPPFGPNLPQPDTWGLKPKLIVTGDADPFVQPLSLEKWAHSLPQPAEFRSFEETDHFWLATEDELGVTVADFFGRSL